MKVILTMEDFIDITGKEEKHWRTCSICNDYSDDRRTCKNCILTYRPKLSAFWMIFWIIMGGIGFPAYLAWKLFRQSEWDKVNL